MINNDDKISGETLKDLFGDEQKLAVQSWVDKHLEKANRGVVIFTITGDDGKARFVTTQFGFKYMYEIDGFLDFALGMFAPVEDNPEGIVNPEDMNNDDDENHG